MQVFSNDCFLLPFCTLRRSGENPLARPGLPPCYTDKGKPQILTRLGQHRSGCGDLKADASGTSPDHMQSKVRFCLQKPQSPIPPPPNCWFKTQGNVLEPNAGLWLPGTMLRYHKSLLSASFYLNTEIINRTIIISTALRPWAVSCMAWRQVLDPGTPGKTRK